MRGLAVLGSTGSVGRLTLDVVNERPGEFRVVALAARGNVSLLAQQIETFQPSLVVVSDPEARSRVAGLIGRSRCEIVDGVAGPEAIADLCSIEVVVAGIAGAAGLPYTIAAVRAGKRVALANKESLVMAGALVMSIASANGAEIIPVDSEHSGVFQALRAGRREEVRRIVLTASGGPFRGLAQSDMDRVTPAEALRHPTWRMGPVISVNSATLMNKALEVIEACWLFGLPEDRVDVLIHPQSIVHAMVEFVDGSVVAQLGPPDMRGPIRFALGYPERLPAQVPVFDLAEVGRLSFERPDPDRFPMLTIGREAARSGGTAGAVLNAANEVAVGRFLGGEAPFTAIADTVATVMAGHRPEPADTLEAVYLADRWARSSAISHLEHMEKRCSTCS